MGLRGALAVALLAAALLAAPCGAGAQERDTSSVDSSAVVMDLVFVRPLAYLAMVGGAILYVPSAIGAEIAGHDTTRLKSVLLEEPYNFAIKRPVGEFDWQP